MEDNKADAERISRLLRHEKDMQVLVAGTGAEALEFLEREPFLIQFSFLTIMNSVLYNIMSSMILLTIRESL